jgi:hypothetical protein
MLYMPYFCYLIALLLFAACGLTRADEQTVPTATAVRLPQTTPVPTLDRQLRQVVTPSPAPTSGVTAPQCEGSAGLPMTRHTVHADIDYANRRIVVRQTVDYINRTNVGLSQIIFNIKSNAWPGIFRLDEVMVDNQKPASTSLVAQRLEIRTDSIVEPGCAVQVELRYDLALPAIDPASPDSYRGYLGYSPRQLNLGHWLATVATRLGDEWVSRADTPIGEQDVLDEADWDVTLNVKNAPETLRVAAPGIIKENGPEVWRYVLNHARDFSLSMSGVFEATGGRTKNGIKVELYTFEDARIQTESGVIDGAAFALDSAVKAVETYSDLYGSYPDERLVIVQGDFPDGMEFSGLVFVGGEYFRSFNGPTSYLMIITVHEISHQWWYGKVANDQAENPWLDEALATYSEYVFIEEYYPALKDWWWKFRVNHLAPEGFVDSAVYEFSSRRAYINAVYLRGTQMLHDLRANLGTEAFFAWLRRYADVGTGRVMTPEQFWSLLSPEQIEATKATRQRYLRQPQIALVVPENP